jgi:hypothetical protein
MDPQDLLTRGPTKQLEELLRRQSIAPGDPGPILTNVQTLIDYIGQGIPTSSKYFALPQGKLDELNGRLDEPLKHQLKRPQLRSFPALMGLFLLLRASGLAVGETKPKRVVLIDPAMLEQWNSLNSTERYMSLLETWLVTASWDIVGEGGSYSSSVAPDMQQVYFELAEEITNVNSNRYGTFLGFEQNVSVNLLHQFGWVRLTYESTVTEGKAANLRSVQRLAWGDAMFALTGNLSFFNKSDQASLRQTLQPFFPQWKQSLQRPEAEYRDGEHTLKLSWGKVWRRLVAPADTTLDDLACAVLDEFKFDHDHLYQFEFRDVSGKQVTAVGPMLDDGQFFSDEFRLGDLPIAEGDAITMRYDFGANWEFDIKLEQISEKPSRRAGPKVIKRSGARPKQYDFDDWE